MIDLDELLGIVGVFKLVDVFGLEHFWPNNLPK
jgi:ABC-type phosphate transport system auxiliary subunit